MIVTCEKCQTSFNLDESLLKPKGSKVKCSQCKNVFLVHPPAPLSDKATALRVRPDPLPSSKAHALRISKEEERQARKEQEAAHALESDEQMPEGFDISGIKKLLESEEEADVKEGATQNLSEEPDDMSFDLDMVQDRKKDKDEAESPDSENSELIDPLGIEAMLEEDESAPETYDKKATASEIDEAFDLGTEFEDSADLSEEELETELFGRADEERPEADTEMDEDLDLALDLDSDEPVADEERPVADADLESELDLALDLEPEQEDVPSKGKADTEDRIEKGFEEEIDEFELDFDFDSDAGAKPPSKDVQEDIEFGEVEELDLSEIEEAIDPEKGRNGFEVEFEEAVGSESEDIEIDLDDPEFKTMEFNAANMYNALDEMLEVDEELSFDKEFGLASEDMPLELDLDAEIEGEGNKSGTDAELEGAKDIDLSEMDNLLQIDADVSAEKIKEEPEVADDDFDLELDLEPEAEEKDAEEDGKLDLDFDLEPEPELEAADDD
ncbi:MAG: hypothetical protein DRI57_27550, partial [Deltaproteobacteria bacterium]